MDNEHSLSIDDIIAHWKADCGTTRQSERGTSYVVIPLTNRRWHFLNLIQTLLDHGHSKEAVCSASTSTKVVLACWPEIIEKLSTKELKKCRDITSSQWREALLKVTHIPISIYKEPEKTQPINKIEKELSLSLDPLDRIGLDSSDMDEIPWEEDLLSELTNIGSKVKTDE